MWWKAGYGLDASHLESMLFDVRERGLEKVPDAFEWCDVYARLR